MSHFVILAEIPLCLDEAQRDLGDVIRWNSGNEAFTLTRSI